MPEVSILVKAKDQASKALKGVGKSVGGLKDVIGKLGIAGPLALGAVAAGAAKLAWDAMELEPTRITFENLTESIGTTAEVMLDELRPATMGMVSDADLMASANKLVSMGLANTDKEAAKLAKMATKLGMAMGKGPTQAMEEFALMLANQSIPRLDTFGISAGTVRTRITELMEETEGMTREQAFMNAVMEEGEISMERVGDISDTTAVKMARVRTAVDNLKQGIGEALVPVLDTAATAFLDVMEDSRKAREELETWRDETFKASQSQEEFVTAMKEGETTLQTWVDRLFLFGSAQREAAYAQEYQARATEEMLSWLDPWQEDMETIVPLVEDAAAATSDWASALDEVQKIIKEQDEYVSALEKAIEYAEELGDEEAARYLRAKLYTQALVDVGTESKAVFVDKLIAYAKEAGDEIGRSGDRADGLRDQLRGVGKASDGFQRKLRDLRGATRDIGKAGKSAFIDEMQTHIGKMRTEMDKGILRAERMRLGIKDIGRESKSTFIDEMLTYVSESERGLEEMGVDVERVRGDIKNMGDAIEEIGPAMEMPIEKTREFRGYWDGLHDKRIRLDVDFYYTHYGEPGPYAPPPPPPPAPPWPPGPGPRMEELQSELLDMLYPGF